MIDEYFAELMRTLAGSRIVRSHEVIFDKRDPDSGYVRANVYFIDGSLLHSREFVTIESGVDRFTYVYHYQGADGAFVFRYDNTSHFPELANFPHHKHIGKETNVTSASPPDLAAVLNEIEALISIT